MKDYSDNSDNRKYSVLEKTALMTAGLALMYQLSQPVLAKPKEVQPARTASQYAYQTKSHATKPSFSFEPKQVYRILDDATKEAYTNSVSINELGIEGRKLLEELISTRSRKGKQFSASQAHKWLDNDYANGEISQLELGLIPKFEMSSHESYRMEPQAYLLFQISNEGNNAKSEAGFVRSVGKPVYVKRLNEKSLPLLERFLSYVDGIKRDKSLPKKSLPEALNHYPHIKEVVFEIDGKKCASFQRDGAIIITVPKTRKTESKDVTLDVYVFDDEKDKTIVTSALMGLDEYLRRDVSKEMDFTSELEAGIVPSEEANKLAKNLAFTVEECGVLKKATVYNGKLDSGVHSFHNVMNLLFKFKFGSQETAVGNYVLFVDAADDKGKKDRYRVPVIVMPTTADERENRMPQNLFEYLSIFKILTSQPQKSTENTATTPTQTIPPQGGITGGQTDVNGVKP